MTSLLPNRQGSLELASTRKGRRPMVQDASSAMGANNAGEAERVERAAKRYWVTFILVFLIGSVGMWIYAAILAVSDPSMSIVPDYHEKALRWDEHLAAERASKELQWSVHIIVSPNGDTDGKRLVTLFVRDRNAQVVQGANGRVRIYHHTRAKDHQTLTLEEKEPGTYEGQAVMNRAGTWQFEIELQRGDERFESSMAQDVVPIGASEGLIRP